MKNGKLIANISFILAFLLISVGVTLFFVANYSIIQFPLLFISFVALIIVISVVAFAFLSKKSVEKNYYKWISLDLIFAAAIMLVLLMLFCFVFDFFQPLITQSVASGMLIAGFATLILSGFVGFIFDKKTLQML